MIPTEMFIFSKKNLQYEISKSEPNTDIYLAAFIALKRSTKRLDAKHLGANLSW